MNGSIFVSSFTILIMIIGGLNIFANKFADI